MDGSQNEITLPMKICRKRSLSSYPVKYPRTGCFPLRNFENAVNFQSEEKLPCKSTWYRDVKSTHIRNRRLLDLPFKIPKCCSDIYNAVLDRQKLKKLKKYGLTRPVRTVTYGLEMEEDIKCEAEPETEDVKSVIFPECYEPPDFSSDEEDDEYEVCGSGSVSECSACSTLGPGHMRTRIEKKKKTNIASLLHSEANELCKANIMEELKKHKLGRNFKLKLDKIF